MHTQYAQRKNGFEESIPQLRGTEDITKDTYNTIIYQEQIMLIAKKLAKFNDAQSDSLCRKPLAKKKKALMEIFRKCFIFGKINSNPPSDYDETNINQPFYDPNGKYGEPILGAINNGYSYEELAEFYEKLKGYASYLFNKSHSASYAVLTLCTMFLKKKTTAKFFAALLSMQDKEEKIDLYSKTAFKYNIKVTTPNVNYSNYDFTEREGNILYGLRSIKGIGENSISSIIKNRPYTNIEDMLNKIEKKLVNKRVMVGLIQSGAFDFYNINRYETLNELMDLRKDKDDRYVSILYDKTACMEFEKDTLGTSLTYAPWWDKINNKDIFEQTFSIESIREKPDKNNNLMGFVNLKYETESIPALIFSSIYKKQREIWLSKDITTLTIRGKKDGSNIIVTELISFENKECDDFDVDIA